MCTGDMATRMLCGMTYQKISGLGMNLFSNPIEDFPPEDRCKVGFFFTEGINGFMWPFSDESMSGFIARSINRIVKDKTCSIETCS